MSLSFSLCTTVQWYLYSLISQFVFDFLWVLLSLDLYRLAQTYIDVTITELFLIQRVLMSDLTITSIEVAIVYTCFRMFVWVCVTKSGTMFCSCKPGFFPNAGWMWYFQKIGHTAISKKWLYSISVFLEQHNCCSFRQENCMVRSRETLLLLTDLGYIPMYFLFVMWLCW